MIPTGKVASEVVAGLKGQPLSLALVLINVMFLAVTTFVLYSVKDSGERRDRLMSDLIETCKPVLQQKR